jgi:hypothetical protein
VQVEPIKPKLKPPGTERLKLNCDVLLSTAAFEFNLRRYNEEVEADFVSGALHPGDVKPALAKVGWCSLALSIPR